MVFVGMIALLVASLVLTYSVFSRYLFKAATDWQDEVAVFCIVGAVFLCGACVQSLRGHVGIEAIASCCRRRVNRVRLHRRRRAHARCSARSSRGSRGRCSTRPGSTSKTTSSTFAPPLRIPYGLMAAGMTLLSLQLLLQIAARISSRGRTEARA